jgi:hypothetical protein
MPPAQMETMGLPFNATTAFGFEASITSSPQPS